MINANTAKRESLLNSKALLHIKNIETKINEAIGYGMTNTTYNHGIEDSFDGKQILYAIKDKLVELGYTVEFGFAKPLPSGCPSEQWNFNNGYIKIKWE